MMQFHITGRIKNTSVGHFQVYNISGTMTIIVVIIERRGVN